VALAGDAAAISAPSAPTTTSIDFLLTELLASTVDAREPADGG